MGTEVVAMTLETARVLIVAVLSVPLAVLGAWGLVRLLRRVVG